MTIDRSKPDAELDKKIARQLLALMPMHLRKIDALAAERAAWADAVLAIAKAQAART